MKKSVRTLILAALLVVGMAGAAIAQSAVKEDISGPYDLRRAVETGLRNNPQINAARFELMGAEYGRKSSLGSFGPSATAGYGWTHLDSQPEVSGVAVGDKDVWAFSLNVTQPLFRGFELLSTYQKAKLTKEQAEHKLFNAELSLVQTIQTEFFSLLKARMDVRSAEDSVARLESQLKVTTAFYEVGLKPKLDVLQAESDLASAQQNLLVAQNAVATQEARLNTLLGLPLENKTDYVGELEFIPFSWNIDDCLKRAYSKRPDLSIGRKSVEIARQDVRITASDFYPDVNAEYNYRQTGDDWTVDGDTHSADNSEWSVGAQATWTFFEWGKTYNAYRQSQETLAQIESDLANTRLEASFEVKRNLLDLWDAKDRIGVARKSLEASKEGYRMAVARYQAQVGTSTEVLDAQDRVTRSEAELNSALADYQTSLAALYASMGEMNVALESR